MRHHHRDEASASPPPVIVERPRRGILLLPLTALILLAAGGVDPDGGLRPGPGAALAKDPNQRPFLAPEYQVKVQRTIARGRRMQTGGGGEEGGAVRPGQDVVQSSCGALQVGNVSGSARPGQRGPRENIVAARDIINAPIGCR